MVGSNVNPDLQKERDTRTFDYGELADLLAGGVEKRNRRKKIESAVDAEPGFDGPDPAFLSRVERFEEGMRLSALVLRKKNELGNTICNRDDYVYLNELGLTARRNVITFLQEGIFIPTLERLATDEQKAKWLSAAKEYRIIGAYAQTELGHGTFVRGLETIADYDPENEEFVLHSPTTSSIKWWAGSMGKTSTYAIVMAQLYIRGVCYGIHAFLVQLRSLEDHKSMPGITVGDVGPKFGGDEIDNGFLILNHVRIPRENMLMRLAQVLPDGTYKKSPVKELTYGALTLARSEIVSVSSIALSKACTIGIRYSAVRRQGEMRPGEPEPQILDYLTQQHKLFPLLATSYAFFFARKNMFNMYHAVTDAVQKGDYKEMKELHAVSCGLKAFTAWVANNGIEVCRMSCGGHGYLMASGFPELYRSFTQNCTVDGESTVMMLQTARFLIRCMIGSGLFGKTVAYLKEESPERRGNINLNSLETLCQLYEQRARGLVKFVFGKVMEEMRRGQELVNALNKVSVHSLRAANAHCHYYVVHAFVDEINNLTLSDSVKYVLSDVARLYALDGISKNSGEFMEEGLLTSQEVKTCHQLVVDLLGKIRPNAVSLVDAFEHTDGVLMSVLGRYDGNVYDNLLKSAKKSELNRTDVIPAYQKYIRPLIKRHQSKL